MDSPLFASGIHNCAPCDLSILISDLEFFSTLGVSYSYELRRSDHYRPCYTGGKPCIKGTRITVYDILAGCMSGDEILQDFPSLSRQELRATLEFAAARERMLAVSTDE